MGKMTRLNTTLTNSGCSADEVNDSLHTILTRVSVFDVHVFWLCVCSALPLASWVFAWAAEHRKISLCHLWSWPRDSAGLRVGLIPPPRVGTNSFPQTQNVGENLFLPPTTESWQSAPFSVKCVA